MDEKQIKKSLRKEIGVAGWIMLLYYVLLNVCVSITALVEVIITMMVEIQSGNLDGLMDAAMAAATSAWGYFVAAGVGIVILFAWKKPQFWREQIWAKGRPMKPGTFLGILCVFLSGQLIYQFFVIAMEMMLNSGGLTMMEGLEALSAGSDSLSMFLYVGILAPVAEELLCRGLVQRTLMPYGKKFSILCSAFLFGIFHGNIFQAPYAFAVGLVLGYVAAEYSIAWAMVLHMINNLVVGEMLTRLTAGMNEIVAALIIWGVMLLAAIGGIITLVRKRREISAYVRGTRIHPMFLKCFFSSAGVITFTVLMILSMIGTCFILITPL